MDEIEIYATVVVIGITLAVAAFYRGKLYGIDQLRSFPRQVVGITLAWSGVMIALLVAAFLLQVSENYSRVWVVSWYVGSLGVLVAFRGGLCLLLHRWWKAGRLARNVVVVGAGEAGARLLEHLRAGGQRDLYVVGVFRDTVQDEPTVATVAGHPVLGTLAELPDFVRDHPVDDVIIALPWQAEDRILEVLRQLRVLPVDIRLAPPNLSLRLLNLTTSSATGLTLLDVVHRPLKDWDALVKRAEDLLLGVPIVIAVLPLMGLIALAVKLDSPGPALFRQKRFGFNNKVIEVWKFRTMYVDRGDVTGAQRTTRNDARVTRIGRFLRATSLDELPQLFNVLRGDMSLVGPRAHPVAMRAGDQLYYEAVADYAARHRVRPGITGWAQVNGLRGEIDTLEKGKLRVAYDIYYIDNWSIWLDLKILLMTARCLIGDRNAY